MSDMHRVSAFDAESKTHKSVVCVTFADAMMRVNLWQRLGYRGISMWRVTTDNEERSPNEEITITDEEITDGMLRWESGTLSSRTMNRILMDVLADLWSDEYRRGGDFTAQLKRYNERVNSAHSAATDGRWHADR